MMKRSALFLTLAASLFLSCSRSRKDVADGADADASAAADGGPAATCTDGDHRCMGQSYYHCAANAWVLDQTCTGGLACSDTLGCVSCPPGGTGCDGDKVVNCDGAGKPTTVVTDCAPSTCVDGACAAPCSPQALAQTNMGCVFFAADLPQIATSGFGASNAATQQFAVAVSNPWPDPVDAVVEQDDAPVGAAQHLSKVAHVTIPPGGLKVIPLPEREVDGYVLGKAENRSMITANAYRITTSRPTSAYQFNPINNPDSFSNDASLLIPVNALDWSYVDLGWAGLSISFPGFGQIDETSFLTIIATRPNTHVRVTPTTITRAGDNVPSIMAGKPFVVTLNEFETLDLEGGPVGLGGPYDFTGSHIEADGPLAVFSGVECSVIARPGATTDDSCCCDHLEEQLFPRSSLGADYIAMRSPPRDAGNDPEPDYFRIIAPRDGTDVTTSLPPPDDHFTLNNGQMHQILVNTDFTVHASHPVMLGQYLLSEAQTMAFIGDPSFILIPPIAQYRNRYIFLVPTGYSHNAVVLSVPAGTTPDLDGQPAQGCTRTAVSGMAPGGPFETLRCPVTDGVHTVASMQPFGVTVHGYGPGPVSYGYPGGMDFAPTNRDCSSDGDCPAAEFCSGGECVPTIQ